MNGTRLVSGLAAALGAWLIAQNVGIGTSSPDSRLHVHNPSGTAAARVGHFENLNDATNNNGVLIRTARAGTDAYILDAQSGTGAGLASRLYVRADGNVGIGTTNPTVRLEVAGRGLAHYGWETKVHIVNLTAADTSTDLGTIINNLLNVYDCVWLRLPRNTTWTWNTQVWIRGGKSLVILPAGWQWGETYLNTGVVINITQSVEYNDGHGACWLGQQTKDVSKLILGNGARVTITGVRINVSICDNRPYHCWGNTRGIFGLTGGGNEFTFGFFTNRAGESGTKLILSHVTIVTTEPVLAAALYGIGYVWFVGVPDPSNNNPNTGNPIGIFRATSCGSTPNPLQVVRTDNGWDANTMGCFVFVGMRQLWLKSGTSRAPGALTLSSASGSGWVIYSE